jgi:hypothetical protein
MLHLKKPSKYFSFCDTVFSSWDIVADLLSSILFYSKKKKRGKRKEKRHSSNGM